MIEPKDIKKMVQHIIRRDKGIADPQIMHPTREWFTGLAITCIMVALGSWLCLYLYTFHSNEMKKEVVIIEQAVPYQAATIKSALEVFAIKQQTYNEILNNGTAENIPLPQVATSTVPVVPISATTTEDIPELIIDPEPVVEDDEIPNAVLAP